MKKEELKTLVKKYFNLTEIHNSTENNEEVKATFAEATLADGTKITNMVEGDFAPGQELHVITEEGEHVVAPSGEHTTESGIVITVDGEGIITGVKHPDSEGEGSLEAAEEVEMSSEETIEEKTEMAEDEIVEDVMEEDSIEDSIIEAIAEVVMPEIEALKAKLAEHEDKMAAYEDKMKDYMGATPASESKTTSAKFSKLNKTSINNTAGPKHNKQRYEMALARLTNLNN